jgi:hypothetical protein
MKKKSLFKVGNPSGVGRYGLTPVLIIGLLMVAITCRAQKTAGALLNPVEKTGFYRIILPPQLVAKCRADLSDIRICQSDGTMIPYVLNTDVKSRLNAGYFALPDPLIRQKDSSNKHSYILLQYVDAFRIERLSFVIKGPTLYKRTAQVINEDATGTDRQIATISLDPGDSVFLIPAVKTRHLRIDVTNMDNMPLVFSRVASAQSGIYILTHLEKHRDYELEGGDSLARKPDYDLHYFTDSLSKRPLDIGYKDVVLREPKPAQVKKDSITVDSSAVKSVARARADIRTTVLLWLALVIVLLLLIYISVKMVKAIAKKETNDRL